MWRGCNEHCPHSPSDSCEGHLCPSEGYRCGCHGTVSLEKHPSSFRYGEETKMSRHGDSRQSSSSDQIWQHTLSPSSTSLAKKDWAAIYVLGDQQPPLLSGVPAYGPVTGGRQQDPEGKAGNEGLQASTIYSLCKLNTEQTKPNTAAREKDGYHRLKTTPHFEVWI